MSWLLFMLGMAFAEEPSMTMEVVASTDIEVYVGPIEVIVSTDVENIEAEIDPTQAFAYSSRYWHNAKVKNERGAYEPVKMHHDRIFVYSEETIEYAWENCDYKLKPLKCSMQNGHYYLETTVHVDDNELVVRAILFDPYAQVIAMGSSTNRKIIKWIKQQEIKQQTTVYPNQAQMPQVQVPIQPNCQAGTTCQPPTNILIPNGGQGPTSQTTMEMPKEEPPLRWTIDHMLLNKHIQQAMLLMWCSTRMDIQ